MIKIKTLNRQSIFEKGGYLEIIKIAYPLIIMSASNTIMQFVDRKFLAANSVEDVAAAMPAGILYFTLFSFFLVTANFTSALVAQFFGAKDKRSLLDSVWTGFLFAVASSLIIVYILPLIGGVIIRGSGHDIKLLSRELEYFYALIPSGAFMCMGAPLFSFFSGRGKTGVVALINTIACLLNLPLNYIFIFGYGIIPPLGILGAGIATSICAMLSFLMVWLWFLNYNQQDYPTRARRDFKMKYLWRLIKYGAPAGIQIFFDVGAFTVVTFWVGALGAQQLGAHVIALSINNMFFIPLLGLSDATSILAGQYIGKREHNTSAKLVYRACRMALFYMGIGAIVYLFFPTVLANFFRPTAGDATFDAVVKFTSVLLIIASLFNFADVGKFIFTGALRGAGDTKAVLIICSGCAYLMMLPGIYLLIFVFKLSVLYVWGFLAIVAFTESMLLRRRFKSGRWRQVKMIEHHDSELHIEKPETSAI